MKTFGKILGLTVLGLLLIIVALGFALTHLFDPNDYKDEIRELARKKAHVELTLNGDIGWSLFPWLGLELHDASIATLQDPKTPFADLQMLGLSVRVMPLLHREVQMSDVRVEGLNLTLARDEHGHGNWEDIGKPLPAKDAQPVPPAPGEETPAPTASKPEPESRPVRLDIDSLTVNNARVTYNDAITGRELTAESIQLSTGAIHDNTQTPLKLTAFLGSNLPLLRARTELSGQLRFDRAQGRYQLEDMRFDGELSGDPLQGKTVAVSAQGQLHADLAANVAQLSGLKLAINQLRALGDLNVRDLKDDPKLSGGLSIAQFNPRTFLDSIGQTVPNLPPQSLTQLEVAARLDGTRNSLALEDLDLKLDGSAYKGRIAVEDFDKQSLRIQLTTDKLDVDRYRPDKATENGAAQARQAEVKTSEALAGSGNTPLPEKPSQEAWSDEALLPVDRLRKLDVIADLTLDNLTISGRKLENAELKASAQGGLLTLERLAGDIDGGNVASHGTLDVRPAVPALDLTTQVRHVPVEQFVRVQGKAPPLKGNLDADSHLTGQGNSQKALVESLDGTASFTINDGVLINANLEQQLCQGIATLNRKDLTGEPRSRDTPFRELKGSVTIHDGIASNPDLRASIPGLTLKGDGAIDLRVLGMDYQVGVIIEGDKSDMPDPACEVNPRYVGIEWPLRCRGPLELGAKACRLDQSGVGKIAAKLAGSRLNEKLEEKFGDKVSPELKNALKGLFNR